MFSVYLNNNAIECSVQTLMDISERFPHDMQLWVLDFDKLVIVVHTPVGNLNKLVKLFWIVVMVASFALFNLGLHIFGTQFLLLRPLCLLLRHLCVHYALLMQVYHFGRWARLQWWRCWHYVLLQCALSEGFSFLWV